MLSVKEKASQVQNALICDEAALQRDQPGIGLWSAVPPHRFGKARSQYLRVETLRSL